jgi:flagellar motor switch protein FliG
MARSIPKGGSGNIGSQQSAEKVTALLLVMEKVSADLIIRQLEDSDIRAVARAASAMAPVGLDTLEKLIDELSRRLEAEAGVVGGSQDAKSLIESIAADRDLDDLVSEMEGRPPQKIWERLVDVSDEKIAAFISNEIPQVAAFVLSNLTPVKASAVLSHLERDRQTDLSIRMLFSKPISVAAARAATERLTRDLLQSAGAEGDTLRKHARLGAMLNNFEREQSELILSHIELSRPGEAQKVRRFVFGFAEIPAMSLEDRERVLADITSDVLVTALSGSSAEEQQAILSALSARTRRIVEAELSSAARPTEKMIADARRKIANAALLLAEQSLVQLRSEPAAGEGQEA